MIAATKEEFEACLAACPLATPDGFRIVGGYTQTRWMHDGREIARESWDSHGSLYDINTTEETHHGTLGN